MMGTRYGKPVWAVVAVGAALSLQSASCSSENNVGETNHPDSGLITGYEGKCNGADDNGDGRIDEGCPCVRGETQSCYRGTASTRRVGTCSDGVIACQGTGEYGTWSGECTGDKLPQNEICNGLDDDCDGTVDEGCSCTKAGEIRACGTAGLAAPCKQGTQTCNAGVWSDCQGSVSPQPEECGNKIDDNCDGQIDELCGCVPTTEICGDGKDNDCDGKVDESGCVGPDAGVGGSSGSGGSGGAGGTGGSGTGGVGGSGGTATGGSAGTGGVAGNGGTAGTGGTLPPVEDCSTPVVADFRDRILWQTSVSGAGQFMANIGGHQMARFAGAGQSLVAIALNSMDGATAYTFGSTTTKDSQLGYLSFADGTASAQHPWPGPAQTYDTSGDQLGVSGLFKGTTDIGLGTWTSDPTLYTTDQGPVAIADLYAASATIPTGAVSGGSHFSISGVPAHPQPGSFAPLLTEFATAVDPEGNVYVTGRFQGKIAIGATNIASSDPISKSDWGAFIVSFDKAGTLRWLEGIQHATGREMVADPTGHYIGIIADQLSPNNVALQLRDTATGAILFNHQGSVPSGLELLALTIDAAGTTTVMGQSQGSNFTLGPLQVAANQNYIAAFDKTGALRWSHELLASKWPDYQSTRYQVVSTGSEVAMMLGVNHVSSVDPAIINIGTCGRAIPRRAYPRDPETGHAVAWDQKPASIWEVKELFVAVLDANTGEHRWSRLMDSVTTNASLAIHSSGDLIVGLHNEWTYAQVDYGQGLQGNASHFFRLRGH